MLEYNTTVKRCLKIASLAGFPDIEHFYVEFSAVLQDQRIQAIELDLTSVTFLTPEAVLALLCVGRLWHNSRSCAIVLTSIDPQVYQYLVRVDLFKKCGAYFITRQGVVESWSRAGSFNLLEITSISSEPEANSQAVYAVYQKASNLLLGRVENRRMQAACDLLNVVTENVTHSQDTGYVLMQSYSTGSGYRIHVGIADLGLGIPTTLRARYPDLGKGSAYLLKSLEMGVTSRAGSGGLGLFNVDRMVRGQQGSLTIRSGDSMLQVYGNSVYLYDHLTRIPGTQVYITVWGNHDLVRWDYLLQSQS
jgi:hypothetical protein